MVPIFYICIPLDIELHSIGYITESFRYLGFSFYAYENIDYLIIMGIIEPGKTSISIVSEHKSLILFRNEPI